MKEGRGGKCFRKGLVVHTPVKGEVTRDFRRQQMILMCTCRAWGPDIPLDVYLFLIYIFI